MQLASDTFVPVAADDWYQRRRQDAEGEFFRSVADQGPRKGVGGETRQGIYCLTASGRLLAYRNSADPEVMLDVLQQALKAWAKLPESERLPGAVRVRPLTADELDQQFVRTPPLGGLIIKVHTRALERNEDGSFRTCSEDTRGFAAATDHLWITEPEWRGLLPVEGQPGQTYLVPASLTERIVRYHLVDNTRGEPPMWQRQEVRSSELAVTVEKADARELRLRLNGVALLATAADIDDARRGYDATLLGHVTFDRTSQRITRFDLLALGQHWGEGPYTRRARAGSTPLAVLFQLVSGDHPTDRIPPQGTRNHQDYFAADRGR